MHANIDTTATRRIERIPASVAAIVIFLAVPLFLAALIALLSLTRGMPSHHAAAAGMLFLPGARAKLSRVRAWIDAPGSQGIERCGFVLFVIVLAFGIFAVVTGALAAFGGAAAFAMLPGSRIVREHPGAVPVRITSLPAIGALYRFAFSTDAHYHVTFASLDRQGIGRVMLACIDDFGPASVPCTMLDDGSLLSTDGERYLFWQHPAVEPDTGSEPDALTNFDA